MIKQLIGLLLMMFCAFGQLKAQNTAAIHEVNEQLTQPTAPTSDALFIKQSEIYKQAKANANLPQQARALQLMGQICYQMGLFTQSLNYHIKADEVYRLDNNKKQAAENLNDLALLFLITKQEKEAKNTYFKALSTLQALKDHTGIARTYANIGHYYEKTLNYDSAFVYQQKAMQVFASIGDAEGAALVHENLGSIYEDQSQFNKASFHFEKALAWFEQGNDTEMLIDAYNNMGDVHRKKGDYQQALYYTKKAEALARKTKSFSRLSSAYRDLGKTYSFLKNTDSTFYYLELSRQYFLKSYSEESKNQEALLKVIYGLDRKEVQIAEMARQEKIAWAIYIASGIAAIVFILVAVVIIRNQRHRILRERVTRTKEEAIFKTKQELMEVDLKNKKLQEEQLKENLHTKAKEITAHTLQTIQKNQLLEDIKEALTDMIKSDGRSYKKELRSLLNKINQNFSKDAYWDDFRRIFEEINQDFFDQLQQINPGLSATDIKFISLIKLNMNAPDIAALLGVSTDSLRVARYRLRKKLKLEQGASLTAFIQSI
jgi:tetratricopeptide (TPR) repeat protein